MTQHKYIRLMGADWFSNRVLPLKLEWILPVSPQTEITACWSTSVLLPVELPAAKWVRLCSSGREESSAHAGVCCPFNGERELQMDYLSLIKWMIHRHQPYRTICIATFVAISSNWLPLNWFTAIVNLNNLLITRLHLRVVSYKSGVRS